MPEVGANVRVLAPRSKEELFELLYWLGREEFLKGPQVEEKLFVLGCAHDLTTEFGRARPEEELPKPERMHEKLTELRELVNRRVLGMQRYLQMYEEAVLAVENVKEREKNTSRG